MPPKKQDGKTVHLVLQRYRWCKILLDETEWRTVGSSDEEPAHCGWLVYTSFAAGASQETIQKAVLTLFQMPFGTWGQWEEKGGRPQTLSNMMQQAHDIDDTTATTTNRLSIVLCPQANLVSQVKRNGKSVQYHGQCDKALSEQLFLYFGLYLQALLLEQQCQIREQLVPESLTLWKEIASLEDALAADMTGWTDNLDAITVISGSFGKRQGLVRWSLMLYYSIRKTRDSQCFFRLYRNLHLTWDPFVTHCNYRRRSIISFQGMCLT